MKKNLKYYLKLNYPITIESIEEDGEIYFSLEIPDLQGCGATGLTLDEAMDKLNDAKELWISESLKRKLPVPEPVSEDDFSGKFLLRIPTKLHMILSKLSKENNLSLNQYVKSVLEKDIILGYEHKKAQKSYEKLLREIKLQTEKIDILAKRIQSLEDVFNFYSSPEITIASSSSSISWATSHSLLTGNQTYSVEEMV